MDAEATQVAIVAANTLAPFLPILLEVAKFSTEAIGEMIVQKGGEAALCKAKAVWAKIKGQYGDDGVVIGAASMVAARPADENLQQILAAELAKHLDKDPKLVGELFDLLGGKDSVQKVLADRGSWVQDVAQKMAGAGAQLIRASEDSVVIGVRQIKK